MVVRKEIKNINDLKGKKYCHPGSNFENFLVTNYVLNEFERRIIQRNNLINTLCKETTHATYYENYIKTLANFFGQSCRRIESSNDTINERLSNLYYIIKKQLNYLIIFHRRVLSIFIQLPAR